MIRIVGALLVGLVFGTGVTVSGMINPAKVLGFLDFAGDWDPTLALVMLGALVAAAPGYALAKRRNAPLMEKAFHIPSGRQFDAPLVVGAMMFGIGWGLAGFCPGPAVAAVGTGLRDVFVFFAAMVAGMGLFRVFSILRRGGT